ncbi:MAG: copper transport protein [Nocardioidaceae bacterium]|nr:copper transport protein [Nocardioidaceae bacterium]
MDLTMNLGQDTVRRSPRHAAVTAILTTVVAAVLMLLVSAAPASAHSELVSSSPANGTRLDHAPPQVTLVFTEGINLIPGGLQLLDTRGATVKTAAPTAQGNTITWPMPGNLGSGAYVVNWRIISADGHPVSGAFSFGVGAAARSVAPSTGNATGTAPWPVVAVRFAGYLAFSVLLGVVAFVTWCSPASRTVGSAQLLARIGLAGGVVTTVAGLLVQGPYSVGAGWGRTFDLSLLQETVATPFGEALLWRLAIYGALFFAIWALEWLEPIAARWMAGAGLVALAVTFAESGHGAASGRVTDLAVDTAHVFAAGIWVGGLIVLTVEGRSVERRALEQFSRLAMTSVLVLVASGVVNSLLRVNQPAQLWQTRYGVLLLTKVALVGGALAAAALSRRHLQTARSPLGSVRLEAGVTVVVLALTAVLTLTAPPPTLAAPAAVAAARAASERTVTVPLQQGNTAQVVVTPPTTGGSRLRVTPLDAQQRPLDPKRVSMTVTLPGRVNAIRVPLKRNGISWTGGYRFPLSGTWKVTLTVEDASLSAVVSAADVVIGQ